jgi:hypothetical protein
LPGRSSFPALDDHLVKPEVTRDEIIGGRRVVAFPANPPHAFQHGRLDYVIGAQVAPGFGVAADLLTRHDPDSDFASDTCVAKEGIDPETGTRYLEEIAFEVVSEQDESDVTEKARRMHRRGVRRIFALFVKKDRRVSEWSPKTNRWVPLAPDATIEDPCLVKPLDVAALLDAASLVAPRCCRLVRRGSHGGALIRRALYPMCDIQSQMAVPAVRIDVQWDPDAEVWVAISDDVPGLATEANTLEALTAKLHTMIQELLEANNVDLGSSS